MKKFLLFICSLTFIFIPINVNAAEITDTEIMGTTEKMIGEELSLSFRVSFSGIEKGDDKTLGIWIAGFELIFDENALMVTGISSTDFDSYVYKEDGKYYVLSEVIENGPSHNNCVNGLLYCADYLVTVKFYVKNTDLSSTIIKMGEVEVGLLDMIDPTKTYTLDDLITINSTSDESHVVNIKKATIEVEKTPENITDITTNSNPLNDIGENKAPSQTTEEETSPSSLIKDLEINKYEIEFDKNKTNYNLTVKESTNKLDIDITLEDDRSTYKIIGADDLKNNNNEVAIVVTSIDNNETTYIININYEEAPEEIITDETKIENSVKKFLTKKNLTYAAIALGVILIIILIIILINKKENKKLNKLLGEL